MTRPLLIVSQSDSLIQIVDINSHTKLQTEQIQISWLLQKPTDLDLHCLQRQCISRFSRTRVRMPLLLHVAKTMLAKWQTVVDPDQMSQSAASELGLHHLLMPVSSSTKGYYGIFSSFLAYWFLLAPISHKVYEISCFQCLLEFCQ